MPTQTPTPCSDPRAAAGAPPEEVESLHLGGRAIESLLGFDRFTNLKVLYLHQNKLRRVCGLDNNFRITELYLHNNRISTLQGSLNRRGSGRARRSGSHFSTTPLGLRFVKILTLHSNDLRNLNRVLDVLRQLHSLKTLTIFKNPCAAQNYRQKIITALPHLEVLDRRPITSLEREAAKKLMAERETTDMYSRPKTAFSMSRKSQGGELRVGSNNSTSSRLFNERPTTATIRRTTVPRSLRALSETEMALEKKAVGARKRVVKRMHSGNGHGVRTNSTHAFEKSMGASVGSRAQTAYSTLQQVVGLDLDLRSKNQNDSQVVGRGYGNGSGRLGGRASKRSPRQVSSVTLEAFSTEAMSSRDLRRVPGLSMAKVREEEDRERSAAGWMGAPSANRGKRASVLTAPKGNGSHTRFCYVAYNGALNPKTKRPHATIYMARNNTLAVDASPSRRPSTAAAGGRRNTNVAITTTRLASAR